MKQPIYLIILLAVFPFMLSCPAVEKQAFVKDENVYGVTQGLFRAKWWNHYERGFSFGEGDFLNEAEADFRTAITQRSDDQRGARTYGMHFLDYFPHRELGIILFKKGLFQDAVTELELSLTTEESAKAKFYLNKARKAKLTTELQDKTPPRIIITAPEKNRAVNRFSVMISGEASDMNYVAALKINGVPEYLALSQKNIPFNKTVQLHPGLNPITIAAQDLLGNIQEESFNIVGDYHGPQLSVLNFANNQQVNQKEINIHMSYSDESGVEYVSLEGEKQSPGGSQSGTLCAKIKLKNGENRIQMEALDIAGNKTAGEITIVLNPGQLVAFNEFSGRQRFNSPMASDAFVLSKKEDTPDAKPPEINFSGMLKIISESDPKTIISTRKKNNRIFIEGQASSGSGIEQILINDTPVAFTRGKIVAFNKLVEFKEGNNHYHIIARDANGLSATKSIEVHRRIQPVDLPESKMTLSIMPFKNTGISSGLADSAYELFIQEIINSERFNVINRGPGFEDILKELKLSQTDLVDKEKAIKAGIMMASETIMIGNIIENRNEVEIYAKLINVETTEYIAVHDVYGQDKSRTMLEYLVAGLASEIVYSVPLIEGQVLKIKGDEFYLDIGKQNHFNVTKGIKCLVYRSTPFVVNGRSLGEDTSILGTLKLDRVNPEFSSAVLYRSPSKKGETMEIKNSDKVITK